VEFYSVRDLRTYPKEVWQSLSENGEVIITNNGKPTALMLDIGNQNLEETLSLIHQANAMRAVNRLRSTSMKKGKSNLSDEEINAQINEYRKEKN